MEVQATRSQEKGSTRYPNHHQRGKSFFAPQSDIGPCIDRSQQVIEYLRTSPNPFSQDPITYDGFTIGRLVTRLSDYDLTKGETIMILNVRPENAAILSTCIEDFMTRFTEDQQNEIQAIIEEVLGPFPQREEEQQEGEGA